MNHVKKYQIASDGRQVNKSLARKKVIIMKTIVLISCVSKKLSYKAQAKDLYISPLFRMNLQYAQKLTPSEIYILSAKYGLVGIYEKIEPYDLTLNTMPVKEKKVWADKVLEQISEYCDLQRDHFIILAGQKYRQYLIPQLTSYEIPMQGLTIGKQLQYLKGKIANE